MCGRLSQIRTLLPACAAAMGEDAVARVTRADAFLRHTSWDETWSRIRLLLDDVIRPVDPGQVQGAAARTAAR